MHTANKSVTEKDPKSLSLQELQAKLGSSPAGLTQAEAQKRLTQYGPNEIEEKKINPFLQFLSYFWGPIPWMIEAAVILSAVVRHWPDFAIILVLLLANAVVGFWEEHQAGNAIEALKSRLAIQARVRRSRATSSPSARRSQDNSVWERTSSTPGVSATPAVTTSCTRKSPLKRRTALPRSFPSTSSISSISCRKEAISSA